MSEPRLTAVTVSLVVGPQVRRASKSLERFSSSIRHLVWEQPNPVVGLIHGLNRAIAQVTTPYFMILHEDMTMGEAPDDFVDRILSRLDDPTVGIVAPRLSAGPPQQVQRYLSDPVVPNVGHEGLTMSTALYRRLGGLDEMFDIPTEDELFTSMYDDAEFGVRAALAGFKTVVAHDLELWHDGRQMSSRITGEDYTRIEAVCLLRLYLKHGAGALTKHFGWQTGWIKEAGVAVGSTPHRSIVGVVPELSHV